MLERFAAEDLVRVDGKTVSLQKWRAIKHPLKVGELESITVNANLKISSKVRRSPFNCSTVCETPCSNSPLPFAAPPRLYSQRDRRHGRVPRSRRYRPFMQGTTVVCSPLAEQRLRSLGIYSGNLKRLPKRLPKMHRFPGI